MPQRHFSHRDIAEELDRIAPKLDGRPHSPNYVGRVRTGYQPSEEYQKLIAQAEANLAARASTAIPRAEVA